MYAFRRPRGNPDRFLNPWENSCRGRWSCRGTVWICAPGSGPRRSCLSRRQLGVSMLFAIFDRQALLRELDRCRETVLQIPITQPECHSFSPSSSRSPQFGILQKIFAISFHLHREGQRSIRRQHEESLSAALAEKATSHKSKIVRLNTPTPSDSTNRNQQSRERLAKRRRAQSSAA